LRVGRPRPQVGCVGQARGRAAGTVNSPIPAMGGWRDGTQWQGGDGTGDPGQGEPGVELGFTAPRGRAATAGGNVRPTGSAPRPGRTGARVRWPPGLPQPRPRPTRQGQPGHAGRHNQGAARTHRGRTASGAGRPNPAPQWKGGPAGPKQPAPHLVGAIRRRAVTRGCPRHVGRSRLQARGTGRWYRQTSPAGPPRRGWKQCGLERRRKAAGALHGRAGDTSSGLVRGE